MKSTLGKFWSALAILAGLVLIYFEYRHAHGVTSDNIVWLLIGLVIIILGAIDLIQKRPPNDLSED
jgi:uncharacterized membrane protein (DUF2068 family)